MLWTRLGNSSIQQAAFRAYNCNGRVYHGWSHVARLYHHAEKTFSFPYDRSLDLSILCHDVIYDVRGNCEERSVNWLKMHGDEFEESDVSLASALIRTTIEHRPGKDNRLILLDLADFLDHRESLQNYRLLEEEARVMYGINSETFQAASIQFLQDLCGRLKSDGLNNISEFDRNSLENIRRGVRKLILAKMPDFDEKLGFGSSPGIN